MLLAGETSSVELVNVFASRCYTVGRELEITTAEIFTKGLEVAAERDQERQDAREEDRLDELPLLHGLPISLKDCCKLKNVLSTSGCSSLADYVPSRDGQLAALLKKLGAIIIVRGNVPQNLMMLHSESFWGKCYNPWNKARSCSGSSGGDAALVAARCIPFSVGSDIGGSVRSPAHYCGIATLKPTPERMIKGGGLTMGKVESPNFASPLMSTYGGMGHKVEDLKLFWQALWGKEMFEMQSKIPPLYFNELVYEQTHSKKIKVGYFTDLVMLPSSAAVKRSIEFVKERLEEDGHEVVPVELSEKLMWAIPDLYFSIYGAWHVKSMGKACKKNFEKPHPFYEDSIRLGRSKGFTRNLLLFATWILGYKRNHYFLTKIRKYSEEDKSDLCQ